MTLPLACDLYGRVTFSPVMPDLSERHTRSFVRNGFVVVGDAIDADLIAEARGAVKGDQEINLDDNQNEPAAARDVFRTINEQLFEHADALVGGEKLKHPTDENFGTYSDEQSRVYVRTSSEAGVGEADADTTPKVGTHTDDQTDGDGALSVLNIGMYLDHVPPRNGGFTVWPGSHWITAEHCEIAEPDMDADPGTRARSPSLRVCEDSPFEAMSDLKDHFEGYEISGDAGSVIFWHPGLVHSSGIHLQPGVKRMTAFTRFHIEPHRWERNAARHPFARYDGIDEKHYADIETRSKFDGD